MRCFRMRITCAQSTNDCPSSRQKLALVVIHRRPEEQVYDGFSLAMMLDLMKVRANVL